LSSHGPWLSERYDANRSAAHRKREPDLQTKEEADVFSETLRSKLISKIKEARRGLEVASTKLETSINAEPTSRGEKSLVREVICEVSFKNDNSRRSGSFQRPFSIKVGLHMKQGEKDDVPLAFSVANFSADSKKEILSALSDDFASSIYVPRSGSIPASSNMALTSQTATLDLTRGPVVTQFEQQPIEYQPSRPSSLAESAGTNASDP
jgi:hypothetical protein